MRKFVVYLVIFFQILLIGSLIRGIYESSRSRERIEELAGRKEALEKEQQQLEEKKAEVQAPDYLEKVAREELHLAKPGEKVVILPEGTITGESSEKREESKERKAIWERWWDVVRGQGK